MVKMLYGQNDGKFENEYLKKLERNWKKWKGEDKTRKGDKPTNSSKRRNLEGGIILNIQSLDTSFFI